MKKNVILHIVEAAIVLSVIMTMLSGCGKENKSDNSGANEGTKTEVSAQAEADADADTADDNGENDTDAAGKSDIATADDSLAEEEAQTNDEPVKAQISATDSMRAYQKFLNNSENVFTDKYAKDTKSQNRYFKNSGLTQLLSNDGVYNFAEFLEKFCKDLSAENDMRIRPTEISYAYIDCGDDGVPELALHFAGDWFDDMVSNYYFILKYMEDERLQVIFYDDYAYRTFGELNEFGYYVYGGSAGATYWVNNYMYIDGDSNVNYIYGEDDNTTAWSFYIPDNEKYTEVAKELGIDEDIEIVNTHFEPFEIDDDYDYFLKNKCMFVYYAVDGDHSKTVDRSGADIYAKDSPYRKFWESTGLKLSTQQEVDDAIKERETKLGVTEKIKSGDSVSWTNISIQQFDAIYAWNTANVKNIELEEPVWEYYCATDDFSQTTNAQISVNSKTPNDITDDYVWFDRLGIYEPDRLIFSDDDYIYKLSGLDSSNLQWYPYLMDICDKKTEDTLYHIDFTNYYTPDSYAIGDKAYVEESIHWAQLEDGILYVSTFHNTYASSAPHNGYITAFDVNDNFRVLWRTQPLTINSNNFVIDGDAIYCGYGFTAEDDFVYVLDKNTGKRCQTTKVKTGPDWLHISNGQLYVRCYDTDYVFDITR